MKHIFNPRSLSYAYQDSNDLKYVYAETEYWVKNKKYIHNNFRSQEKLESDARNGKLTEFYVAAMLGTAKPELPLEADHHDLVGGDEVISVKSCPWKQWPTIAPGEACTVGPSWLVRNYDKMFTNKNIRFIGCVTDIIDDEFHCAIMLDAFVSELKFNEPGDTRLKNTCKAIYFNMQK